LAHFPISDDSDSVISGNTIVMHDDIRSPLTRALGIRSTAAHCGPVSTTAEAVSLPAPQKAPPKT